MSYLCRDCSEEFDTFGEAEEHHHDAGHTIGAWNSGVDSER